LDVVCNSLFRKEQTIFSLFFPAAYAGAVSSDNEIRSVIMHGQRFTKYVLRLASRCCL
jgi:hypothetical protein